MNTSESVKEISTALIAAQCEFPEIQRTKTVNQGKFSYKYAPLDAVMAQVRPAMQKHGLGLIQGVTGDFLHTRLVHTSGEWIECAMPVHKDQPNNQAYGSELQYKKRYSVAAVLNLVMDEDDDGNAGKSFKSSPMDDFRQQFKELDEESVHFILYLKHRITRRMQALEEYGAYEDYVTIDDQEMRGILWGQLPSNIRTALTKQREKEKAQA